MKETDNIRAESFHGGVGDEKLWVRVKRIVGVLMDYNYE